MAFKLALCRYANGRWCLRGREPQPLPCRRPDTVTSTAITSGCSMALVIGRNLAYRMLKNRDVTSVRIGRVHRIPKANVIQYIAAQAPAGKEARRELER